MFEVASVKPNTSGRGPMGIAIQGCRFVALNVTLRMVLQYAYRPAGGRLPNNQIIGGPEWMDSDRFDIQAKPEGEASSIPQSDMQLMVQSLLEDRFQLKSHHETHQLPVYDLVVARDGLKMKLSDDQTPAQPSSPGHAEGDVSIPCSGQTPPPQEAGPGTAPLPRGSVLLRGTPTPGVRAITLTLSASATPISILVNLLPSYVGRPIINKTNIQDLYDIEVQFVLENGTPPIGGAVAPAGPQISPPLASDPSGISLFTAIQEQLGLKLESSRGPVEVLVIDSVQKPSEN
jgi:uncharacterized protein (TIGR03435 family)